jgi:hypothetical protein
MASIKISVSGLAKFMKATPSRQRTMLKDYKFKTDRFGRKRPQIVRYSEARAAIVKYHQSGNEVSLLVTAVANLQKKEASNPEKDSSRIRDNIRAIETYMKYFSESKFTVLDTPKPKYVHGEVEVSATPELYVEEGGKKKLIKLDFNLQKPDEDSVNIILKVMYEASLLHNLSVSPKDVVYLDVSRQNQYIGSRLNKRLKQDIDAACETIADIWPKVKQ